MLHMSPDADTGRPLIVLPPQGMNLRTGWNQLHVRLARMLGQAGWSSLRFDVRGLGQSAGALDFVSGADLFLAVENGGHLADTRAAITFAEHELGVRSVILVGVCGGAVTRQDCWRPRIRVWRRLPWSKCRCSTPATRRSARANPCGAIATRSDPPTAWRRVLSLQLDFKFHLRSLRSAVSRLSRRRLRPRVDDGWLIDQLGAAANVALASAVERCCVRGIPLLFAFGSTDNAATFRPRAFPPLPPGLAPRLATVDRGGRSRLSDALAYAGAGRDAARLAGQWLHLSSQGNRTCDWRLSS